MTNRRPRGFSIDPFRILQLLDRLDVHEHRGFGHRSSRARSRRRHARFPYRQTLVKLDALHPGGTGSQLSIHCRNISVGGLAFVHSGFLHPGTRCDFSLPRLDGVEQPTSGWIVSCRHLDGVLHELSVRFERTIDTGRFVAGANDSGAVMDPPDDALERDVRWAADEIGRALNPPNLSRAIVICSLVDAAASELNHYRLVEASRVALGILRRTTSVAAAANVLRDIEHMCRRYRVLLSNGSGAAAKHDPSATRHN